MPNGSTAEKSKFWPSSSAARAPSTSLPGRPTANASPLSATNRDTADWALFFLLCPEFQRAFFALGEFQSNISLGSGPAETVEPAGSVGPEWFAETPMFSPFLNNLRTRRNPVRRSEGIVSSPNKLLVHLLHRSNCRRCGYFYNPPAHGILPKITVLSSLPYR